MSSSLARAIIAAGHEVSDVGTNNGNSVDYPDLAVGNNSLYISWDAGFGGCTGGFQVGDQVAHFQPGDLLANVQSCLSDSETHWMAHLFFS
jgi:hypothetical protein